MVIGRGIALTGNWPVGRGTGCTTDVAGSGGRSASAVFPPADAEDAAAAENSSVIGGGT